MNKFRINKKWFEAKSEYDSRITIQSHPKPYNVVFENFQNKFEENQIVLVDSKVSDLYGIHHSKIIKIDATEENKSIDTVLSVCDKLSTYEFDRGNVLVVIGGGIIQDIGAFVAKIYKRGIEWIYIPTTLLSQCDSCIGGKTALNFKNQKNQLALFSAPSQVIIDINFLNTLSSKEIKSGYGEIIKLFLIGGDFYVKNYDNFDLKEKIFHCLSIKKAVIEFDEFEICERKSLNYGHSFGHVIESLTNYEIAHGEAVVLGIEIINRLFTQSTLITNLINTNTNFGKIKKIDKDLLVDKLKTDKKVTNGIISLVVVTEPGNTIFIETKIDEKLKVKVNEMFVN